MKRIIPLSDPQCYRKIYGDLIKEVPHYYPKNYYGVSPALGVIRALKYFDYIMNKKGKEKGWWY